ncbi:MAG: hypothetical protein WBW88_06180, partial [Rhodothermales bacterium]
MVFRPGSLHHAVPPRLRTPSARFGAFWMPGESASDGIESMAETGQKGALTAEVEAAIADGTAEFVLSGGGINPS